MEDLTRQDPRTALQCLLAAAGDDALTDLDQQETAARGLAAPGPAFYCTAAVTGPGRVLCGPCLPANWLGLLAAMASALGESAGCPAPPAGPVPPLAHLYVVVRRSGASAAVVCGFDQGRYIPPADAQHRVADGGGLRASGHARAASGPRCAPEDVRRPAGRVPARA